MFFCCSGKTLHRILAAIFNQTKIDFIHLKKHKNKEHIAFVGVVLRLILAMDLAKSDLYSLALSTAYSGLLL